MRQLILETGEVLNGEKLCRTGALPREIMDAAADIVDDVRARGDEAVREYTERFDGFCPTSFRVDDAAFKAGLAQCDERFIDALKRAKEQIIEFHKKQLENSWDYTRANGVRLGMRVLPVASAAIYVPGGRAQYPSTVLMDSIPAKVAGVEKTIMVTPPQKDGSISPYTLAAAAIAGIDEVYAVGGAQAVAACAYGTESIPQVEKIVGPGNAYVAAAKARVSGDVGIDMIAGPSEVCILADATADPSVVAADLMAQAEHDPMAACYLVSMDEELPKRVLIALELLCSQSPREEITRASLDNHGLIVIVKDKKTALAAVNSIAPEHLELHCKDARSLVEGIRNAGAIFVGAWSSEPLGDYIAGPNHTLPTGGTARFSNPLGVYDFQKRSSVIEYDPQALLEDAPHVQTLAQAEGLWAHALSVGLRAKLASQQLEGFSDIKAACVNATTSAWPYTLKLKDES